MANSMCLVTGLAVLADMLLTTHFMTLVLLTVWKLPLWLCAAFYIAFAPIEAAFWSSTLTKIPNGAQPWLPDTCILLALLVSMQLPPPQLHRTASEIAGLA